MPHKRLLVRRVFPSSDRVTKYRLSVKYTLLHGARCTVHGALGELWLICYYVYLVIDYRNYL